MYAGDRRNRFRRAAAKGWTRVGNAIRSLWTVRSGLPENPISCSCLVWRPIPRMFFSNFTKTSVSFFLIIQDKRDLPYERTNELRKPSQIYDLLVIGKSDVAAQIFPRMQTAHLDSFPQLRGNDAVLRLHIWHPYTSTAIIDVCSV